MQEAQLPPTEVTTPTLPSKPPIVPPSTQPAQKTKPKGELPMKKEALSFITLFLIGVTTILGVLLINEKQSQVKNLTAPPNSTEQISIPKYAMPAMKTMSEVIQLPDPKLTSSISLESAIYERRSRRFYSDQPVSMQELSQVLWSAQGITDEAGHRAAPSARSAYPFTLYVVVRNVSGLEAGLYQYNHEDHSLGNLGIANAGDLLIEANVQDNSKTAPVVIVMSAAPAVMQKISPDSDPMPNIYLEGGHIGQNIYLQVEALKMATVVSGGFDKMAVGKALQLDTDNEKIVYLVPFGHIGEEPVEEAE
jgi:SagB-type dehydrogenase family enzyme